jgi:hypothetical protein
MIHERSSDDEDEDEDEDEGCILYVGSSSFSMQWSITHVCEVVHATILTSSSINSYKIQ